MFPPTEVYQQYRIEQKTRTQAKNMLAFQAKSDESHGK